MTIKSLRSAVSCAMLAAVATYLVTATTPANAGVSDNISFQGRLTDEFGDPLPDGPHVLDFFFYDVPVGGKPLGAVLEVLVEIAGGDGVVSTPVGPVDPDWFAGTPRYLGITVDDVDDDPVGDELEPRILLTAVPFALRALNLPETTIIVVQGGFVTEDFSIGEHLAVGIPTADYGFHVRNTGNTGNGDYLGAIVNGHGTGGGLLIRAGASNPNGADILHVGDYIGNVGLVVAANHRVGVAATVPLATFDVGNRILFDNTLTPRIRFNPVAASSFSDIYMATSDGSDIKILRIGGGGNVQSQRGGSIMLYGNEAPGDGLGGSGDIVLDAGEGGMVRTRAIQITGGGDLAEPFNITPNGKDLDIQPGMVVVIDPTNPGALKLSQSAYDRKVAGILSGANGINPGLILRQEGTIADGAHDVALIGRVWCWCDASNGSIEPGDMLTTSGVLGHAMKVTDFGRAYGTVIGKAMTRLDDGRGLVLVLVSLQ